MIDDTEPKRASIWPPIFGTLIVAGVSLYAWWYGVASLSPFLALLFVGALATVLFRLLEAARARFDNVVVQALSAIALMISGLCGILFIAGALLMTFMVDDNPIDRFMAAKEPSQQTVTGFVVAMYSLLGLMALIQAASLWTIVRTNAFGPKTDA